MKWYKNIFAAATLIFLLYLITGSSTKVQPFFNPSTLSVLCHRFEVESGVPDRKSYPSSTGPCPLPVPDLRAGRHEVAEIGDYYTEPPNWINVTLATIGQNFMKKNILGYDFSAILGSILVGTSSDVVRVMISGGNVLRPLPAIKRYLGIMVHPLFWVNGDIGPGSHYGPNAYRWNQSSFYESMNMIRSIHGKVAYQAHDTKDRFVAPIISKEVDSFPTNEPLWEAFRKDLESSQLVRFKNKQIFPPRNGGTAFPFNQFGMMLQYWAYVATPIINHDSSLWMANPSDEELLGYMHFWAFLAHVMGLREEYNIALQPDIPTAKKYYRQIIEEYFVPGLFKLDYEHKVLIEEGAKAFTATIPFVDTGLLLKHMCEDVLRIKTTNIRKVISAQARLYSSILTNSIRPLTKSPTTNAGFRFVINGMIQVSAIKHFGFNILTPTNFTNGILNYDEQVLKKVNLWHWRKRAESDVDENHIT